MKREGKEDKDGNRKVQESNRNTSVERPAAAWAERTKCEVSARG